MDGWMDGGQSYGTMKGPIYIYILSPPYGVKEKKIKLALVSRGGEAVAVDY